MGKIGNIRGFLYGIAFGAGGPIPGISSGSMAIFLNIYEDFFQQINIENIKKRKLFFSCFFVGNIVGLFGVSGLVLFLLNNFDLITLYSFMGLILGCVPMVYKKARAGEAKTVGAKVLCVALFLISLGFMIYIALSHSPVDGLRDAAAAGEAVDLNLLTVLRFTAIWSIGGIAMLIPGLGASIIMLVFGVYSIYLAAVANFDLPLLAIMLGATIFGLVVGFALIKKLMEAYLKFVSAGIFGFILGSLFVIFPGVYFTMNGILAILFGCVFSFISYKLSSSES